MRPAPLRAAALTLPAFLATILASSAAHAQSYGARLGGLDMASASGAAEAVLRIERAAKAYCGMKGMGQNKYADIVTLKCRRELTDRAVQTLNAPQVNSAYRMRAAPASPAG